VQVNVIAVAVLRAHTAAENKVRAVVIGRQRDKRRCRDGKKKGGPVPYLKMLNVIRNINMHHVIQPTWPT
jgi:hypothetical protein